MNVSSATDSDLLAAWVHHRDESAFHELVVRYAGLVQMAAQRTCGDVSLAADASQLVFTQLAQNSKSLLGHPSLAANTAQKGLDRANGKQISEEILGLTRAKRAEINSLPAHCHTRPDRCSSIKFLVPTLKHWCDGSH